MRFHRYSYSQGADHLLYLYDPRTNVLTKTTYEEVIGITGLAKASLYWYKCRRVKLKKINCYLTDSKITLKQRREWYVKEEYPDEAWQTIDGSDGKYQVSSYGRFRRIHKNGPKFLLPYIHKRNGHLMIKVRFKDRLWKYKVSHLVAHHFIGQPKSWQVLYHKNKIKTDNFVANLAYISKEELGQKTGFMSMKNKPVLKVDKNTKKVLAEYRSVREAGKHCFMSYQAVSDRCYKRVKANEPYILMFADEYNESVFSAQN